VFELADGVGGKPFYVGGLDFYFFDGDEGGGGGHEVAEVDVCVGSFSEFLACVMSKISASVAEEKGGGKGKEKDL
jgi:hypothetical protein